MVTPAIWIKAARPRTLPLALSGVLMGCGIALAFGAFRLDVSLMAVITATLIQIFSNLANDYGDSLRKTDNEYRLGPPRTVQSGEIGKRQMERGMALVGGLSFFSGLGLLRVALGSSWIAFAVFLLLGILCLVSAYFYTGGRRAYGYAGFGDAFVFVFFGLVAVAGSFFLNAGFLAPSVLLPSASIGLFSSGVLNLNNMRDMDNDRNCGKLTLPVRLGLRASLLYHALLIALGWIAATAFTAIQWSGPWQGLYAAALPLFLLDLARIRRTRNPRDLDPFLKRLALSTLAFTLLFCMGSVVAKA